MQEKEIQKPYIIGVTGCSGSGKTLFLKCFLKHFAANEITLISQDDYYIPTNTQNKEENRLHNFDLPTSISRDDFYQDITSLIQGKTVHKEEYRFNNPQLEPRVLEIKPAPILIVEGLFIFYYQEINALLDHRIFIHANEEIALKRRIKRDYEERGYSKEDVLYKWDNHVLPAFNKYLLPYKKQSDQVIENNTDNAENLIRITNDISAYLRQFFF
jgi:uridine kinase